MNEAFKFSDKARAHITDVMNAHKLDVEARVDFIGLSEFEVDRWQRSWPPIATDKLVEGRRRLKAIEGHLAKLQAELRLLPDEWRIPLWINMIQLADSLPPGVDGRGIAQYEWHQFNSQMLDMFLPSFQDVVANQIDHGKNSGSRDKARKNELIKQLAVAFVACFDRKPSATPKEPFIELVAAVGEAAGLTIGKDAVGTALKEVFKEKPWEFGL